MPSPVSYIWPFCTRSRNASTELCSAAATLRVAWRARCLQRCPALPSVAAAVAGAGARAGFGPAVERARLAMVVLARIARGAGAGGRALLGLRGRRQGHFVLPRCGCSARAAADVVVEASGDGATTRVLRGPVVDRRRRRRRRRCCCSRLRPPAGRWARRSARRWVRRSAPRCSRAKQGESAGKSNHRAYPRSPPPLASAGAPERINR